jgi:hypothetical protein
MTGTRTILVLENAPAQIAAIEKAVKQLGGGYNLKLWQDGYSMRNECEPFFAEAALISLHDRSLLQLLAECCPVCPVIIHSGDVPQHSADDLQLLSAGWLVERLATNSADWVESAWLSKARELLATHRNTWPARLPKDHPARMQRALLSLDGLSVGDAFGECFFGNSNVVERRIEHRDPPPAPWSFTDDTTMALSIVRCLKRYGHIERDPLAASFAREYDRDPRRGYGGTAHGILRAIGAGMPWREAAGRAFHGDGSCGNGGHALGSHRCLFC